jgi:3-dehydroquinate dehydratase-2
MLSLAIVNGPNLNLVGVREKDIYGSKSLSEYFGDLQEQFPHVHFSFYQSNVEGELINYLHGCRDSVQGIILNAGAYTHTSIAIADAIAAIDVPVVEVHISNIYAREEYRRNSLIASKCVGSITGLGLAGYKLAAEYFVNTSAAKSS